MSKALEAFWERAAWDPVIKARLQTIRADSTELAIADLVRIGAEFGFVFSEEEYRRSLPSVASASSSPPRPSPKIPERGADDGKTAPAAAAAAAPAASALREEELDRDPRGVVEQEEGGASTCCSHTDADY